MTMRVRKVLLAGAVCTFLLAGAGPAAAGNHLRCYKVRDPNPKTKIGNVQLLSNTGLTAPTGPCTVGTRATMCCDAVDKLGVPAQTGGGGPTGETRRFCCYKVKCPKGGDLLVGEKDQFGNRTVSMRKAVTKMLCAPSSN